MTTVYGISTCDTTKKAMAWLKKKNIAFRFHDYRVDGITKSKLNEWCKAKGWEIILNKKSTSWRSLTADQQSRVTDQASAVAALEENSTLIKRPIIEHKDSLLVGYDEKQYSDIFK